MKVLMITPWYPDEARPNSGIFIKAQAMALAQMHQVVVIAIKVDYGKRAFHSSAVSSVVLDQLTEHRLVVKQSLPLYNQVNYLWIACRESLKIARAFRPDIVHGSIGFPGAIVSCITARMLGVPFVFTEHTRPRNNFRSFWHKSLTKLSVKRADAVMAVSHSLAADMRLEYQREAEIVPNVVDVERYRSVQPASEKIWQLGFVGGLNTPVKGLDVLLKALSKLHLPFHLHICGDGSLLAEYKQLTRELAIFDRCTFYGFIAPAQMPVFFSRLHVMICSSRYETFNVSLIEAMAAGRPVVSTRCGGPNDFVNESNGILCNVEDPESLLNAIGKLLDRYSQYSEEDIRAFADRYKPVAIASSLTAIYQRVISSYQT